MNEEQKEAFVRMARDFTACCTTIKPDEYQMRHNRLILSVAAFLIQMHEEFIPYDPDDEIVDDNT